MKLAFLGHKHVLLREGGVEVVVYELTTRMAALGHDVTVYDRSSKHVMNKAQKNPNIKEHKGVKIKRVLTIDKKGLAAMTSSFFASWKILFSKAEVVHYHAEGPCAMIPIIKFFSRKRIIVTIHGLDWQRAKWVGFATKYIKFGEKENKELKRLNKNLKNSNTHKDTYASKLKEENEKLKKIIRDYCQIIDTNYGGVIRMYVEENEESNEKDFKLLKEVLEDDN